MTYQEQLQHPLWQKKRLQIMEKNDFKCSECGAGQKTLHIHHGYYARGRKVWDYEDETLHCLCDECHSKYGNIAEKIHRLIATRTLTGLNVLNEELSKIEAEKRSHTVKIAIELFGRDVVSVTEIDQDDKPNNKEKSSVNEVCDEDEDKIYPEITIMLDTIRPYAAGRKTVAAIVEKIQSDLAKNQEIPDSFYLSCLKGLYDEYSPSVLPF